MQDTIQPEVRSVTINLEQLTDGTYVTSGDVPVVLELSDDRSGIRGIQYGFTETADEEVSGWQTIVLEPVEKDITPNESVVYTRTLTPGVSDGEVRYLIVRAFDWYGNNSDEWTGVESILIDSSAPQLSVTAG